MSSSDHQVPLTRRQLRELRETGSVPVVDADADDADDGQTQGADVPATAVVGVAASVKVAEAPVADPPPRTRREARERERLRTAAVPVAEPAADVVIEEVVRESTDEGASTEAARAEVVDLQVDDTTELQPEVEVLHVVDVEPETESSPTAVPIVEQIPTGDVIVEPVDVDAVTDETTSTGVASSEETGAPDSSATIGATFGDRLLEQEIRPGVATSFDELISADSRGGHTAPSALIFNPPAEELSLDGPVAATGDILVTGSYELPNGLGSRGHAAGTTDGREIDAVLIDGELPAASSPTPIAASAAISTLKPAGEIIRRPAPDKGNGLMWVLTITAGVLTVAVVGALVYAAANGVF